MNPDPTDGTAGSGRLATETVRLLGKALAVSPDDWETRRHLAAHYLAVNDARQSAALIAAAPHVPADEDTQLFCAAVEAVTAPDAAVARLRGVLSANKACARAYLIWAEILRRQDHKEEARKKYGAATLLDESLATADWSAWLGEAVPALPAVPKVAVPAEPEVVSDEDIADAMAALVEAPAVAGPKVTFEQIGGMKEVIGRIQMNIIHPFSNPEAFQRFKRGVGGGILMYGPPGCGKTHIARATAGECRATFIPISITDVLSRWLGESERRLHELFELARRRAPTVIFIDEVDAIGVSRMDASASMAPIVNVLLSEMDGIAAENRQVMVLAATNSPWRVDSALRRPGRFDRVLFVPPPDLEARRAILEIYTRDLPTQGLELDKIARATDRFSGADLRALVARASEEAITEEMKSGKPGVLTTKMLSAALKTMRPSTIEWMETARSYASYGNRAGIYDDLVAYLESQRP